MWGCNCKYQLNNGTHKIKYHPTEVNEDEICVLCGYYSIWYDPTKQQDKNSVKVTVVNKKTFEIIHFTSKKDASNYMEVGKSTLTSSKAFQSGKPYYPKSSKYIAFKGDIKRIPSEVIKRIKKETVHMYHKDKGYLGVVYSVSEASQITGDKPNTIRLNLDRCTMITKSEHVYANTDKFSIKEYVTNINKQGI